MDNISDIKNSFKKDELKINIKNYGVFNIDGFNKNGTAVGNKIGLFSQENELKDFCQYIYNKLTNEESIKKLVVVDFKNQEQIPYLEYCFKVGVK